MRQPVGSALLTSQLHHYFTNPLPARQFPLSLMPRHLVKQRDPNPNPLSGGTLSADGSGPQPYQPKPVLRDDRIPQTTPSWMLWAQNSVVEQWKEACAEVVPTRGFDMRTAGQMPGVGYEFPDGYSQVFGEERYRFTEMLFNPKDYFNQVSTLNAASRMG